MYINYQREAKLNIWERKRIYLDRLMIKLLCHRSYMFFVFFDECQVHLHRRLKVNTKWKLKARWRAVRLGQLKCLMGWCIPMPLYLYACPSIYIYLTVCFVFNQRQNALLQCIQHAFRNARFIYGYFSWEISNALNFVLILLFRVVFSCDI